MHKIDLLPEVCAPGKVYSFRVIWMVSLFGLKKLKSLTEKVLNRLTFLNRFHVPYTVVSKDFIASPHGVIVTITMQELNTPPLNDLDTRSASFPILISSGRADISMQKCKRIFQFYMTSTFFTKLLKCASFYSFLFLVLPYKLSRILASSALKTHLIVKLWLIFSFISEKLMKLPNDQLWLYSETKWKTFGQDFSFGLLVLRRNWSHLHVLTTRLVIGLIFFPPKDVYEMG